MPPSPKPPKQLAEDGSVAGLPLLLVLVRCPISRRFSPTQTKPAERYPYIPWYLRNVKIRNLKYALIDRYLHAAPAAPPAVASPGGGGMMSGLMGAVVTGKFFLNKRLPQVRLAVAQVHLPLP